MKSRIGWVAALLVLLAAHPLCASAQGAPTATRHEKTEAEKAADAEKRAARREARRTANRAATAGIFEPSATISAGWAMGLALDAFDPTRDASSAEKLDLAPFLNVGANFGDGNDFSTEVKLVLANFGRLVNKADVVGFSADSSGSSVRRAVITDFTIRTPVLVRWDGGGGILWNVVNAGFSMDAQGDHDAKALDAASYWFTGPTFFGRFGHDSTASLAAADLLVGTSEILTGVESFDFDRHKKYPVRIRPRVWFHFPVTANGLDIGLWGDLGPVGKSPDAVTAFVSTRLFRSKP